MSKICIDTKLAKTYGVNAALILEVLIDFTITAKYRVQDGYIRCSLTEFEERLPFLTRKQIRYAINKLVSQNALKTRFTGKCGIDRVKWYEICDEEVKNGTI